MISDTKKYKSYENMLQDIGEEEMTKIMRNDVNYVAENFTEIWRLFNTLKEKQVCTDKRLNDLEFLATNNIIKETKNDS